MAKYTNIDALISSGIPNFGYAKFCQDVIAGKFTSEKVIFLIRDVLIEYANKNEFSIANSNLCEFLIKNISELVPNNQEASSDISHIIENLAVYLNQDVPNVQDQLRNFCRQIYAKLNLDDPENIDLINEINDNIETLISRENYEVALTNLKRIFCEQGVIVPDQIFIAVLESMDPFFENPITFDFEAIEKLIEKSVKKLEHQELFTQSSPARPIDSLNSSKLTKEFFSYEINQESKIVKLYTENTIYHIYNREGLREVYGVLRNQALTQQHDTSLIDKMIEEITFMFPEEIVAITSFTGKAIDSSKSSQNEDTEFFNQAQNQQAIAKINQLNDEQKSQIINFYQKYSILKFRKDENLALRDIEHEDLQKIITIFSNESLLPAILVDKFIINFVNSAVKIEDSGYISIVIEKGKGKVEEDKIEELENKLHPQDAEQISRAEQEERDYWLAVQIESEESQTNHSSNLSSNIKTISAHNSRSAYNSDKSSQSDDSDTYANYLNFQPDIYSDERPVIWNLNQGSSSNLGASYNDKDTSNHSNNNAYSTNQNHIPIRGQIAEKFIVGSEDYKTLLKYVKELYKLYNESLSPNTEILESASCLYEIKILLHKYNIKNPDDISSPDYKNFVKRFLFDFFKSELTKPLDTDLNEKKEDKKSNNNFLDIVAKNFKPGSEDYKILLENVRMLHELYNQPQYFDTKEIEDMCLDNVKFLLNKYHISSTNYENCVKRFLFDFFKLELTKPSNSDSSEQDFINDSMDMDVPAIGTDSKSIEQQDQDAMEL